MSIFILDIDPKEIKKALELEPNANSIARAAISYYELGRSGILAHAHEVDEGKLARYLWDIYGSRVGHVYTKKQQVVWHSEATMLLQFLSEKTEEKK